MKRERSINQRQLQYRRTAIVGGLLLLLVISGVLMTWLWPKSEALRASDILETNSGMLLYQAGTGLTDYGYIDFRFKETDSRRLWVQGVVDLNSDGTFSEDEWLVKNEQARVLKGFPNRFCFTLPSVMRGDFEAPKLAGRLYLTLEPVVALEREYEPLKHYVDVEIVLEREILDTEFGIDVPGANEELKRGVYASDFEETGVPASGLPDLTGGPMDCFAIASANNLINLATLHGMRDRLPSDPKALIETLKQYMAYRDGITNANFLVGKAAFVEAVGLPITTEEIRRPSIEDLYEAFATGDAVEVSTTMIRSRSGMKNTGHVLTGVSAYQDGDEAGLAVHDPATPSGTDTLNIRMSDGGAKVILVDYPLWDGLVFVDAIFVQRWRELATTEGQVATTEEQSTTTEEQSTEREATESQATVVQTTATVTETVAQSDTKTVTKTERPVATKTEPRVTSKTERPVTTKSEVVMPTDPTLELAFEHVKPGEYSEVYGAVTLLAPGTELKAWLTGGGQKRVQLVVTADRNGLAYFTWRIYQYGRYTVEVELPSGELLTETIEVK